MTHLAVAVDWTPLPGTGQAACLAIDDGLDVCVTGIGGGKSDGAAFKVARWSQELPIRPDGAPTNWLVLGPDYKVVREVQLEKVLKQFRNFTRPFGEFVTHVRGGNDPQIQLANGSIIYGMSGNDPEALRGFEFDGVWMDEAAICKERAFAIALSRMRSASAIRAIITTSPKPGWVWRVVKGATVGRRDLPPEERTVYSEIIRVLDVRVHRWDSAANTTNEGQVLDAIGAVLEASQRDMSKQELGGQFLGVENDREAFNGYDRQLSGHLTLTGRACQAVVLGIDLGQTKDYTWLTILSKTGICLWQKRFKQNSLPGATRDNFYPLVEDEVIKVIRRWRVKLVQVDTAMHGRAFAQNLRRRLSKEGLKAMVDGFDTSRGGKKQEALEDLSMACDEGLWTVPDSWKDSKNNVHFIDHVKDLRREIEDLEVEDKGNGKRVFSHPPGGHDDGLVSHALAYAPLGLAPPRPAVRASQFKNQPPPREKPGPRAEAQKAVEPKKPTRKPRRFSAFNRNTHRKSQRRF